MIDSILYAVVVVFWLVVFGAIIAYCESHGWGGAILITGLFFLAAALGSDFWKGAGR